MKKKILNLLLIITSLFGYLEWGKENHSFLFEAEYELLRKVFADAQSLMHPFVLLPLAGQIILLITLFQKTPGKVLTYLAIALLSVLLGFMFVIGVMSKNYRILFSVLPFFALVIIAIRTYKHIKQNYP